jgi:hypothetical protein
LQQCPQFEEDRTTGTPSPLGMRSKQVARPLGVQLDRDGVQRSLTEERAKGRIQVDDMGRSHDKNGSLGRARVHAP